MYRDGSIADYIADASSDKPAPGGGSISALVSALGTTMGSMAANFTVGREKFADVEPQVKRILEDLARLRTDLLALVDEDVKAYGVVSRAYGMPRQTDDEKAARADAIQKALVVAMDVPLRIMDACGEVLRLLAGLVDVANPNLISDVGVSVIITEAGLKDKDLVRETAGRIQTLSLETTRLHDEVLAKVERKISGG